MVSSLRLCGLVLLENTALYGDNSSVGDSLLLDQLTLLPSTKVGSAVLFKVQHVT